MAKRTTRRTARRRTSGRRDRSRATGGVPARPGPPARTGPTGGDPAAEATSTDASDGDERAPAPWWRRLTGAVLAAGALATAVTAIVSLLPSDSPDPADNARFTGVRVTAGVPLGEYQRRTVEVTPVTGDDGAAGVGPTATVRVAASAAAVPEHVAGAPHAPTEPAAFAGAGAAGADQPATTVPPTSETDPPPTSLDGSTTTTGGVTSLTPSPGTEPPAAGRLDVVAGDDGGSGFVLPPAVEQPGQAVDDRVDAIAERMGPDLGCDDDPDGCTQEARNVIPIAVAESVDEDGEQVPPDEAAERVVELLRNARMGGDGTEPLGVVVVSDIELEGLRGETVLLTWSMWQQDGTTRLHGDWLDERLAYRLEPTTDHDTASLDLWIPLPRAPGRYFVRVALAMDGSSLASADSDPFS